MGVAPSSDASAELRGLRAQLSLLEHEVDALRAEQTAKLLSEAQPNAASQVRQRRASVRRMVPRVANAMLLLTILKLKSSGP